MRTWQVSFSLFDEHLKDLQEALGLQSVQQVLDLSDTIIKVREVINPLALVKDSSLQQKGSVLVIADYPLTGKSCLAFNLAKDWLDTTNVENVLEPVVLVLSPGTQADWSVERLDAEIRATTGSYAAGIQTLVIIDNLEECVQKAIDLNELLAWLFEPAFGYHKLFLYTAGMVFERRIQNILRTHLMRLEESTASS